MEWRRIELVCGVLGGALGLIALGVWLFAPVYLLFGYCDPIMIGSTEISCPYYSAVQLVVLHQEVAFVLFTTALLAVPSLGIPLFAVWHSRARRQQALILLWVCTVLLCLATLFVGRNPLGVFFVPADVLGLGASIVGPVAAHRRIPAQV